MTITISRGTLAFAAAAALALFLITFAGRGAAQSSGAEGAFQISCASVEKGAPKCVILDTRTAAVVRTVNAN